MANPPSDQGIPILTEVIGPQTQADAEATAAPAPASQDTAATNPPAAKISQAPRPPVPPTTTATAMSQSGSSAVPRTGMPAAAVSNAGQTSAPLKPTATVPPASVTQETTAPAHTAASGSQPVAPTLPTATSTTRANVSGNPETEASLAPMSGAWSDSELRDLENELRLRITRQVLGRIDFVLDHRVRNSVTEVVDAAIDALAAEIKRGLHETLTDMVARAVAQEVSRLQSGKK